MIIKIVNPSSDPYYICLPVYFYKDPDEISKLVISIELLLYTFCFYIVTMKLRIYLKIRRFHRNFLILSAPIFGLWYEAIIAKLITMAYQLKLFSTGYDIGEHVAMWTRNPKKMLTLESLDGLEMLLIAGFMEWHYLFSVIFGGLSVCIERVIASMLIKNYEKNTKLCIPIFLTVITQLLTIFFTLHVFYDRLNIIAANIIWIVSCILASTMHFMIKKTNKDWQRKMKNPMRKDIFTVSQQFQVKENLRAVALSQKLLYSLFGVIAVGGLGIVVLILELVPPFFCHFLENIVFL
ncbi:hypothetical protein CRE_06453 [Caenorhabditis remanei]|uniref:Uncharacterized protein n=1 Tax=Caenorhabditis remanei TaxID=31234 RepID=E3M140_CAERE|nr:hypothetical protein CRE_06453 [Caenorhabditis remanei]